MKRIGAMTMLGFALAAVTAALAFGAHATQHAKLVGTVGKNNAYKISLNTSNGKVAKALKAGTYTLVIHDDSNLHNYELDGPHGKSWTFTSVPFMGTKTMTIKLATGIIQTASMWTWFSLCLRPETVELTVRGLSKNTGSGMLPVTAPSDFDETWEYDRPTRKLFFHTL